jgi:DNA-binding response OmpR family regulator
MKALSIAIYSDDASVRESVIKALGKKIAPDFGDHVIHQFATGAALKLFAASKKPVDLFILDGEAVPEGGMGLARQLKDEIFNAPPILLLVARQQDAWLAGWSRAEAVVTHPIDPFTLAKSVANLIRSSKTASR